MATSTSTSTNTDEIVALEHAYWDAIRDNDSNASIAMTFDPCIVTGPQGAATFDHKAMAAMNDGKTWSVTRYEIADMNAQTVGDDAAFLGYTIKLDMEVEGESLSMECAESSAWVRQGGNWLCVLHSETPLGDPFGRNGS